MQRFAWGQRDSTTVLIHSADAAERIRAIEDAVLFKVKVGRWRGAVFADEPTAEVRDWLVAAGIRE
ncbi:hypothetical protein [Candidatus Protofrankia californiensis]|uniref:hypothetical protein n=1 Tax=Candidatus Protofrankia californiensis TaxID=1839754 RepID=UPI0019D25A71|nr:hypothetical protein [Candidatus Protofrankia californiensis]